MRYLAQSFEIRENFTPASRFQNIGELATDIITILVSVAGIAAIFFIIIGGVKIVTAGGDTKKLESARNTIFYAIIGLAVTALAFVIIRAVQYFFGADLNIL